MKASQEHGFFQVIDHGVSENLMDEAMGVFEEFFNMPAEDKAIYYSVDPNKSCRLYTSTYNYANEKVHYWRDNLTHSYASPTQDCINFWPEKPTRYREVVGAYTKEVKELVFKILYMICEGLGLQRGYFEDELSKINLLSVNYYPRCPDPSLTLGMHRHCDPNLITILQQGNVCGLQVLIDGEWISVEPLRNAFVVIIGCQLQIIRNEKIKSAEHRVVTNSKEARATIGTFIIPSYDCSVKPATALVEGTNPPLYRDFKYKDFLSTYAAKNGEFEAILESYKLQA